METREPNRVVRRAGLVLDLEVLLGLEQAAETRADELVVVDDEETDRHYSGTSATTVVPAPGRDSTTTRPPKRPTRSRIPSRPIPSPVTRPGSKPTPSSSTTTETEYRLLREDDAHARRACVLDDVRQRLLHEPVQRRLDLGREPAVALEVREELDRHAGLLREVVGQPFERGDEAEVVERLRAELDREAANVLEGRTHELAHLA